MERLDKFFSSEGFFLDKDEDGLFDGFKGKIILQENAKQVEKITALNVLARLAYESVATSLDNIVFEDVKLESKENNIRILIDKKKEDISEQETSFEIHDGDLVISSRSDESLEKAGSYIYARFPYVWDVNANFEKLDDVLDYFKSPLCSDLWISKIIVNSEYQGLSKIFINAETEDEKKYVNEVYKVSNALKLSRVEQIIFNLNGNKIITIDNVDFKKTEYDRLDYNITKNNSYDLSNIFSPSGFYKSNSVEFMPDTMNVSIALPSSASNDLIMAASNIVSRLANDCFELKMPLISTYNEDKTNSNILLIQEIEETKEAELYIDELNNNVILQGNSISLSKLAEKMAKVYPFTDKEMNFTVSQLIEKFTDIINCKNVEGQLIHTENYLNEARDASDVKMYLSDISKFDNKAFSKKIMNKYNIEKVEILDHKEEEKIWQKNKEFRWEVDTFKDILEKELYPIVNEGDTVKIVGYLSEEPTIRENITNSILEELKSRSINEAECDIYSSYKQGFSWITEKVIPYIKSKVNIKNIENIVINFKPFLPEGITEWLDEDGATPTLNADRENNENKWFDLPIRFLQELYPVDDIIAQELNIDREKVLFMDNNDMERTYEFLCVSENNEIIFRDEFEVKTSERPYLDEYPKIAKVHPTTGWITIYLNEEIVIDRRIKTDLENIWDYYQNEVLSSTKDYILETTNGEVKAEYQPFFKQMKLEIEASEPDYKLPTRKDLISSLDSLHEDIYFAGLDFFKTLGMRTSGEATSEPGLVLPIIKKVSEKSPKIKSTLIKEKFNAPVLFIENKKIKLEQNDFNKLNLYKITQKENNTTLHFKVEDKRVYQLLSTYCHLIEDKILNNPVNDLLYNISFDYFEEELIHSSSINKKLNIEETKKYNIDNGKVKTDELIGYDDYIKIMEHLKNVNGIKAYPITKSYQGREIYTIEMVDLGINDIVSRYKLINSKPVYYINSRHHANEVSSTNAAFDLIKLLLSSEEYKEYLKKLNIVIIPFENVDGGYIHYELQKENPEWKLHIARYNSVGQEFAFEYFNTDTKYTEALAYTRLWYKWLPDVIVDNHGVPSHEWDQQFSGYVSPWFKGFWLPRALYYGYFWYLRPERYKENREISKGIQDAVADYLNNDNEISKWNRDWKDRFEKYANKWMPKLFPADYYKNLIFYWIPYEQNKKGYHSSHRYPNITCMDWTTEVSDETAQGEYLQLCAKAHLKASIATMKYLISLNAKPEVLDTEEDGFITLKKVRSRPLGIK